MNIQKAAVIGCGFVGASTAFNLVQKDYFRSWFLLTQTEKKQRERQWTSVTEDRLSIP